MAENITIGSAYVQLMPSAKGFGQAMSSALDSETKGLDSKGSGAGSKFGSAFTSAAGVALKGIGIGITSGVGALSKLIYDSVNNFADYEQLVGGVETLFGKSAYKIKSYANDAFSTAGMSTNAYMETVTSFSAALVSGLGGDTSKAADIANQALIDMSDNANKMGTSMDSIQNAYQGFAKQNYTMLDNLKLGYGGTQAEMVRLINDSGVLNKTIESMKGISFDTVISAIHEVQTNLGITGTTADEASTTISGSIGRMKASWENLIVSFTSGQNVKANLLEFVDSAQTVIDNVVPKLMETVPRVIEGLSSIFQTILAYIPGLLQQILPPLLEGATMLVNELIAALPELMGMLEEVWPTIVDALITLFVSLIEILPTVVETAMSLFLGILDGLTQALPTILPAITDCVVQIVMTLTQPANLILLINAAGQLIVALLNGLMQSLPQLIAYIPAIIANVVSAIIMNLPLILATGIQLIVQLLLGIVQGVPRIISYIPNVITSIVSGFTAGLSKMVEIGRNIVQGIWNGISSMASWIWDKVSGFASGILSSIKGALGIASPSKEGYSIGRFLDLGIAGGITDNLGLIDNAVDGIVESTTGSLSSDINVNGRSSIVYSGSTESSGIYVLLERYLPFLAMNRDIIMNSEKVAEEIYEPIKAKFEWENTFDKMVQGAY